MGTGAFGSVWRAFDTYLGREVAVNARHYFGKPAAAPALDKTGNIAYDEQEQT